MERRLRRVNDTISDTVDSIQQNTVDEKIISPDIAEPETIHFPALKVSPLVTEEGNASIAHHSGWTMVILGAIIGLISGFLIANNTIAPYEVPHKYSGNLFFIIWGPFIGAIVGFILFLPYSRLKHSWPLFSILLFIPAILFFLCICGVLAAVTDFLAGVLKIVLVIIGVIIVIGIIWAWLAG